nr:MAG TPA: hypothetical protein [Caudoviricetes sp.]
MQILYTILYTAMVYILSMKVQRMARSSPILAW